MAISFNPMGSNAPQNNFSDSTEGYVQGAFLDDPTSRMYLSSGRIKSTVTTPVWGGVPINELVSAVNSMGSDLDLSTTYATITGFTTNNQGYNMILTPGNNVPQAQALMSMNFFRMGSNARIAVQCDTTLAAALDGNSISQQVSWDFTNQKLIAFAVTALPVKVLSVHTTSKIVSYNATTKVVSWVTGAAAIIQL